MYLVHIIFWYSNGIYSNMLLAVSHINLIDLQAGVLAVIGGNIAFIAFLSYLPRLRDKLTSRLIGF